MPQESRPMPPLAALWQAPAMMWVLLGGEGLAVVLASAPGIASDRWVYFGLASLIVQWVSALTLSFLYVLRNRLERLHPVRLASLVLALLLASTWIVVGMTWAVFRELWPADTGWIALMAQLTGIALTVGALGLAAFQNHWRTRQLAVRAKQAELEALQARIRPHFLFNTLNTGAALVHQRPGEAERLLLDLADLFRAALAGPREIPLQEELALTQRYLEIESLRFGDRLRVDWQVPPTVPAITVPALSVQPLVENAIRHGVERMPRGGQVDIAVIVDALTTRIRIGNALPPDGTGRAGGHRVGLSSTHARVEALTHGRGRVEIATDDGRYVATIVLPNN